MYFSFSAEKSTVMICDGKLYARNGQARTAAEAAMPPMRKLRRFIVANDYSTKKRAPDFDASVCFASSNKCAERTSLCPAGTYVEAASNRFPPNPESRQPPSALRLFLSRCLQPSAPVNPR